MKNKIKNRAKTVLRWVFPFLVLYLLVTASMISRNKDVGYVSAFSLAFGAIVFVIISTLAGSFMIYYLWKFIKWLYGSSDSE